MKKILIADDEASLRFLISETLKINNNFEVEEAEDGIKALEKALKNDFDLIILDVKMPGLTGYEVAEKYHKSGKNAIIIILTAEDKLKDKDEAYSSGSDFYMVKPFNPSDLLSLVESILA